MKHFDYLHVGIFNEHGAVVYEGWLSRDRGDDTETGNMLDALWFLGHDQDYTIEAVGYELMKKPGVQHENNSNTDSAGR